MRDQIIAALRKVYDPEMPVNIYDLGLIYDVDVNARAQVACPHDSDRAQLPGGRNAARAKWSAGRAPCRASRT